ncbi:MAG: methyltransferase domain-containing protein [Ignavibacteriales bacterium]|nr:methyltransferase domain-containing protein [Ignavibacteriales bacterium]
MEKHICPFWVGYFLASPIRKLYHNPNKILSSYVRQNMNVIDIGSAMGFFSLPLAEMVKPNGKVFCVDVQKRMLDVLKKKAKKKKLTEQIEFIYCTEKTLDIDHLKEQIDFVLAFAVLHELPETKKFFEEIYSVMKKGSKILIAEPKGHVSNDDFERTLLLAKEQGFNIISSPKIAKSHSVVLDKN